MISVRVLSDLHYELLRSDRADDVPKLDADVTIVAGDYHTATKMVGHARLQFPVGALAMICGNHEHYGSGLTVVDGIKAAQSTALMDSEEHNRVTRVLENETMILDIRKERVRIIGATLWTDFDLYGNYAGHSTFAQASMNDYLRIKGDNKSGPRLRPLDTRDWHIASKSFIERELRSPFEGRTIVVTHHLPSLLSVAARFKTDPLTPAFASHCDDLIALQPNLWVHGHTHDSCNYMSGQTRIICNPRGYGAHFGRGFRYENKAFDPKLIFEL
jgi:predicted phosphodiesterase